MLNQMVLRNKRVMWISFWFQIKGEKGLLNDLEKNTETLGFEE